MRIFDNQLENFYLNLQNNQFDNIFCYIIYGNNLLLIDNIFQKINHILSSKIEDKILIKNINDSDLNIKSANIINEFLSYNLFFSQRQLIKINNVKLSKVKPILDRVFYDNSKIKIYNDGEKQNIMLISIIESVNSSSKYYKLFNNSKNIIAIPIYENKNNRLEYNIDDLLEYICDNNISKSLEIFDYIYDNKKYEMIFILRIFINFFNNLKLINLEIKNNNLEEILDFLMKKKYIFFDKKQLYKRAFNIFNQKKINFILNYLFKIEDLFKEINIDNKIIFHNFLIYAISR